MTKREHILNPEKYFVPRSKWYLKNGEEVIVESVEPGFSDSVNVRRADGNLSSIEPESLYPWKGGDD